MAIQYKTLDQIKVMRRAGLLVGQTLELLRSSVKVGMRTDALDAIAAANIKRGGGTSNFKGYHGFPATICISINEEIVHGIPGDRVINDGDVVSIDAGAIIDGWHGDAAFSIIAGTIRSASIDDDVTIPVEAIHHVQDSCLGSLPENSKRIIGGRPKNLPSKLVLIDGGISEGNECEAFAYHGFNKTEPEFIDAAAQFILSH